MGPSFFSFHLLLGIPYALLQSKSIRKLDDLHPKAAFFLLGANVPWLSPDVNALFALVNLFIDELGIF